MPTHLKTFQLVIQVRTSLTTKEVEQRITRALERALYDSEHHTISLTTDISGYHTINGWRWLMAGMGYYWRKIWPNEK